MLRQEYRSDEVAIGLDLYEKCLPSATHFDRAVGFFAGSVFMACPEAFSRFFTARGRMRVVCSPVLDKHDIDEIFRGLYERPNLIRKSRIDILAGSRLEIRQKLGLLLAWLIASGKLEIRIALRSVSGDNYIYHEKLGLFADEQGNWVAYSGSANESLSGLEGNFESVDLFRSWLPEERKRVDQKIRSFNQLWQNQTTGVEVVSFAEAATRGLLKARANHQSVHSTALDNNTEIAPSYIAVGPMSGIEEVLQLPSDVILKRHQKQAVRNWIDNKGHGLFTMATGAGKTIAALATATKLYEWLNQPTLIVIVCPYLHLCTQWSEEAKRFGLNPLICAIDRRNWFSQLSTRLFNLNAGTRRLASIVVSNDTFASKGFQKLIKSAPPGTLLISDEVHHFGAQALGASLPPSISFRLGLSATPNRVLDPVGTARIREYFGDTVAEYTLRQALDDGILCPYRYFPVLVELTDQELDEYLELTKKIGQSLGRAGQEDWENQYLQSLLLRRARLLATASGKIPALLERMSPLARSSHNLVYCGDGTIDAPVDGSVIKHVDLVVRLMSRDLGMTVGKYVADTTLSSRSQLRSNFASGTIQALVAIRCLDEGIDIPETRRAFILASSTNPRQFIQRRGRILRRSPNKEMAEIYDFIVAPSVEERNVNNPLFGIARRLFRRELARIMEFASLAVNGPEALYTLLPLRESLNLMDYGGENEPAEGYA